METWKDIPDYEGLYRISSKGRVMGLRRNKEKKSSQVVNKCNGYTSYVVSLSKNGIQRRFHTHILTYTVFNKVPTGMIDFLDGNKTNMDIDNLVDVPMTDKFRNVHCAKGRGKINLHSK